MLKLSDEPLLILTVESCVIFALGTLCRAAYVQIFVVCSRVKFHTPRSNSLLFMGIKRKAKEKFYQISYRYNTIYEINS
jgi:hypothetical protein